jgi:hypothetical protein
MVKFLCVLYTKNWDQLNELYSVLCALLRIITKDQPVCEPAKERWNELAAFHGYAETLLAHTVQILTYGPEEPRSFSPLVHCLVM